MTKNFTYFTQIKQASWHRGGTAALLLGLGILGGCNGEQNKFVPPPLPKVGVGTPLVKPVTPYLEITGTLATYASVNLVARVEGYLKAINYADGEAVKAGAMLFEIEPAAYEAQVKENEAGVMGARAALVQTEHEFERQSTLFRQGVNTAADLDAARAKRDADKANLDAQEASLQSAEINLSYTRIAAPFDGIVTRHLASKGQLVGAGGQTNLASLVQLDPIYVSFNLSDQDLMRLRANAGPRAYQELKRIQIEVGLKSEEGFPHRGTVSYVSPELDPQTATILVRGTIENADDTLLPGMFVRVRMPLGPPVPNALLVPDRILQQDQQGRYVLVVGTDDEVEQQMVQLGELVGGLRVITSGLKPDDRLVLTALDRAIPGHKVTPQSASATAIASK